MRIKKLVLIVAALMMVASLAACGQSAGGGDQGSKDKASPKKSEEAQKDGSKNGAAVKKTEKQDNSGKKKKPVKAPEDKTLRLSIPKLNKNIESIPTGLGNDTQLLTDNAAVHVRYPTTSGGYKTGWPWQKVSNVYLAGHVEGYKGTPSYKAFDGIGTLKKGDDIIITDANGKKYTYKMYEKKIVHPTNVEVLNPVPGKNIVTLQTCEIVNVDANGNPDYSNTERLIVRGELKDVGA